MCFVTIKFYSKLFIQLETLIFTPPLEIVLTSQIHGQLHMSSELLTKKAPERTYKPVCCLVL